MVIKTYLSINLVQAACHFSSKALEIERKQKEEDSVKHRAYVIGTIWTSVGLLESYINELYSDAAEQDFELMKKFGEKKIKLIGKLWEKGIPRTAKYSILEKYNLLIDLVDAISLNRDSSPYQDVSALIALRNSLMHYEPSWNPIENTNLKPQKDLGKLEKKLKGKFKLNPLTGLGNPFFPDKCLGYGCSNWSISSCVEFIDTFCDRIDLKPTYEHIRKDLLLQSP